MKICASLGSDNIVPDDFASADAIEVRTDIFKTIPKDILRKGQTGILTFKTPFDASVIPEGWIVDVGDVKRPDIPNKVLTSYHDFKGTPDVNIVIDILNNLDGDIVKGAFAVNSLKDNVTLLEASRSIEKEHVILGMGELGRITRIRQNKLKNRYTYAYVGTATAPGQFSLAEMNGLGDYCTVTGILGADIGYTRSPAMHAAAFAHSGINGKYLVFDVLSLDRFKEMMIGYDIKGVNVTRPYKTDVIAHLDRRDKISEDTGAVNTVVNENGKLRGYNTDVYGIEMSLKMNSVNVKGMRALILGTGGASRSTAYFLSKNGCNATVTGRDTGEARRIASEFGVNSKEKASVDVKGYDLIVNCIPLAEKDSITDYPVRISEINRSQIIFDMVYGVTHLTETAKERNCVTVRGEDMLAYQGIKAFELFTSKSVPFKVMRDPI